MKLEKIDVGIFKGTEILTYRVDLLLIKLNEAIDIIKNIQAATNQNTRDIAKLETRMDSD